MAEVEVAGKPPKLKCRACDMKASQTAPNIFEPWNHRKTTIAEDLAKLTGLVIYDLEQLSNVMCHTCCTKLLNAINFVEMVVEVDSKLNKDLYLRVEKLEEPWPETDHLDYDDSAIDNEESFPNDSHLENFETNDLEELPIQFMREEDGRIMINGTGKVLSHDDDYDPLTGMTHKSAKKSKNKFNKRRKLSKPLDSDDKNDENIMSEYNIDKNEKVGLERVDVNEISSKVENIDIRDKCEAKDESSPPETDDDLNALNLTNRRGRPFRKVVLKNLISKMPKEKIYDSNTDSNAVDPDVDLILEAEDEEPTINKIAKQISAVMPVPKKITEGGNKKRKNLKYLGKTYVTQQGTKVLAKSLGPRCRCRKELQEGAYCPRTGAYCKQAALTDKQRQFIFNTFWGFGDITKQWAFIIKFAVKSNRLLPYSLGTGATNRQFTFRYFLPLTEDLEGEKTRVCRKMFNNTLDCYPKVQLIWEKFENRGPLKGTDLRQKREDDKIASVCEHFEILQKEKLELLEQRAAGLYPNRILKFGFRKMYARYCEWFDHSKYIAKPQTCKEYQQIIARNITWDQIMTLQQGDSSNKLDASENAKRIIQMSQEDGKVCINIQKIKKEKREVIFRPDNDSDEESDVESVHSNFSDEIPAEVVPSNEKVYKEESASDESSDESDRELADDIESSIKKPRNCDIQSSVITTRKRDIKTEVADQNQALGEDYQLGHIVGESLGRQFLTTRGRLVIMGLPCNCKLNCFEKLTERQREFIFSYFWRLGRRSNQWDFILQNTVRMVKELKYTCSNKKKKIHYKFKYSLPLMENINNHDAEKVEVCSTMFCQTLVVSAQTVQDCYKRNDPKADNSKNSEDETVLEAKTIDLKPEDLTLHKATNKDKDIDDIELDHTQFDFVYKQMSLEEFMNAMSSKRRAKTNKVEKKKKRPGVKEFDRTMRPPCDCARVCRDKIDEELRLYIHNFYWGLDTNSKRYAFFLRFSERVAIKRHTVDENDRLRRKFSFHYYLPTTKDFDGERVRVCCAMFCKTLSLCTKKAGFIWSKFSKDQLFDRRGLKRRDNISDETKDSVKEHIRHLQEIEPELSEYKFRRTNVLKVKMMYRNYLKWLETSRYPISCRPSRSRYRVMAYRFLGREVPKKWLRDCGLKDDI